VFIPFLKLLQENLFARCRAFSVYPSACPPPASEQARLPSRPACSSLPQPYASLRRVNMLGLKTGKIKIPSHILASDYPPGTPFEWVCQNPDALAVGSRLANKNNFSVPSKFSVIYGVEF
jgi:hypothetical protein